MKAEGWQGRERLVLIHPSTLILHPPLLPTDARLSGAFAAGLADPQAERNTARPGGAETVDTRCPWNSKPENRLLPSWWEQLNIRLLTDKKKWTAAAAEDDGQGRLGCTVSDPRWLSWVSSYWFRSAWWFARKWPSSRKRPASKASSAAWSVRNRTRSPTSSKNSMRIPRWPRPFLSPLVSRMRHDARRKAVATACPARDGLPRSVARRTAGRGIAHGQSHLRRSDSSATAPGGKGSSTEKFRAILRDEKADIQRRFRAALALADYVPESEAASWTEQDLKFVAEQLVASNAEFQPLLRDALRPIRARLLGDLERIFADPKATDGQRLSAANAFADYAASDIAKLSELLTVATPEQYAVLYPIVAASPAPATVEDLGKIAATAPPVRNWAPCERVPFGQRRANAAVTLLRLGEREKVLPVFEMTDDPEALTQFIFRCRPRGVGVDPLLDCLRIVSDAPEDRYPRNARYALLLALGEFHSRRFPNRVGKHS